MMSSMPVQDCIITTAEDAMWPDTTLHGSMDSASSVFSDTSSQDKECKENGTEEEVRKDPGRWTADEHILFLKGLSLHGKSWKKISEIVKTRTVVQIRTHAQKYLIKLEKARKAGHQGVLMMDGKGVDNTERRGTTKKTSPPAGTVKSAPTTAEAFIPKPKKQVQRPAGHLSEQLQQQQQQEEQQLQQLQQHLQQQQQKQQQQQQQQQLPPQPQDTSAPSLMPIVTSAPSSYPLLNMPAGAMPWLVTPYSCAPISSTIYSLPMMASHGLDMGGPLISPSSQARANFLAALVARGAGRYEQDLSTLPLSSVARLPLDAEMSTQFNNTGTTTTQDESCGIYKRPRAAAGLASVTAAAGASATTTAAAPIGPGFVVPQQPGVLPAAISSYARPMMMASNAPASSSSSFPSTTTSFSPAAPGSYTHTHTYNAFKVPDPLEELMQSLTRGKLSSSSSSPSSSSIGPEVDELPSMHDMHVWELTDKHARPSSLRSWDEEDFDSMSSSSSSVGNGDHVSSCSPASVSEFQFPSAA